MKLYFMTKRNTNGNRKYLSIDTENKCYTTADLFFMPSENHIETTSTVMRKLQNQCIEANYQYNWYGR